MKGSAEVNKEVVVMVVMEDVTEEEEVVDKVTKMAAELVFSVDAQKSFFFIFDPPAFSASQNQKAGWCRKRDLPAWPRFTFGLLIAMLYTLGPSKEETYW